MKKRKILCFLGILLTLGFASPALGQTSEEEDTSDEAAPEQTEEEESAPLYDAPSAFNISLGGKQNAVVGDFFWGLLADPILLSGTTAVAVDAGNPSVLYAGGAGFIAVSSDNGANWEESYRFSDSIDEEGEEDESEDDANEDVASEKSSSRANALREYLRRELEDQFDTSTADDILDDISDEELMQAEDISDIEALQNLELDMDPDLTNVQLDTELIGGVSVSVFDSYIDRYIKIVNSGAESEAAVKMAAHSQAVSQFVSTATETYAVTSDIIYFSVDKGENWAQFMSAPAGEKILSMAVSEDSQVVAIGLTNGMLITHNGGDDWAELDNEVIPGGIFELYLKGQNCWALSTEGIYHSTDRGLTWEAIVGPWDISEYVIDIAPGSGNNLLVLTNVALYYSTDSRVYNAVPTDAISDESIHQVISSDPSLATFTVRTDLHVYQFGANGWISQNKSLNATELGPLAELNDGYSFMMMASPSGLWLAQSADQFVYSPEYQAMHKQWSKEPTDLEVIQRALDAHFLGDILDTSWGARNRFSWLLPIVGFDYYYRQQKRDQHQVVTDMALGYVTSDKYTFQRQTTLYWQIVAKWNLKLAQGVKEEASALVRMSRAKKKREQLIKNVQRELARRRAFQMTVVLDFPKLPNNTSGNKKIIKTTLGLQEIEAHLHYLTGGYYLPAIHADNHP